MNLLEFSVCAASQRKMRETLKTEPNESVEGPDQLIGLTDYDKFNQIKTPMRENSVSMWRST